MKILMVIPYAPNLISVRPYNLIRFLSAKGHDVTLATVYRNAEELADIEGLRSVCANVIAVRQSKSRSLLNALCVLPRKLPLQSVYSWSPTLSARLSELLVGEGRQAPFDVVHVEHLRGAEYGLFISAECARQAIQPAPAVVWDSVDCISLLFEQAARNSRSLFGRWVTRFELGRTRDYEGFLSQQFDRILMTTSADREAFLRLAPNSSNATPVSILSNGVDLDYFSPGSNTRREQATLLVSGKMSYHANITMVLFLVEEVMPRIWTGRPDVRLNIVGKDPPASIRSLARDERISVTGMVPDVRSFLRRATVAVAPIQYGVGIQNKVLEAMACETPVVASPQAASALSATSGRELFVAEDIDSFTEAILALLADRKLQRKMGLAGRAYVEKHHDWSAIALRLENLYRETIAVRPSKMEPEEVKEPGF